MKTNIEISHTKNMVRAKVRNSLNEVLMDLSIKFWLIESVYDEILLKENIEVIKLYYEKFSKWIVLHNASVLAFLALLIWHWDKWLWLKIFLRLMLLSSLISAVIANVKVNILFNTLIKKQRGNK
jgi:hypothetical protein